MNAPMERAGCPDDEMLAAFVDGRLEGEERRRMVEHLAACPDCYATFEAASEWKKSEGVAAPAGANVRSFPRRAAWLAAAAAVAAAVLLFVLPTPLREWWQTYSYQRRTGIRDLVVAANQLPYRATDGRLSGGFAYKPVVPVTRGGADAADESTKWKIEAAAGAIHDRASASATAENLHALGVANLALGNDDAAVRAMEDALRVETDAEFPDSVNRSTDAPLLNDLAVAYYARARRTGQAIDYARSYETADRAFEIARTPEASWNRALAASALSKDSAASLWRQFDSLERDSAWKREAGWRNAKPSSETNPVSPDEVRSAALAGRDLRPLIARDTYTPRRVAMKALWMSGGVAGSDWTVATRVGRALCDTIAECLVTDTIDGFSKALAFDRMRATNYQKAFRALALAGHATNRDATLAATTVAYDALSAAGAPLAVRVATNIANDLYERNRLGEALSVLEEVPALTMRSKSALAETIWMRGTVETTAGYHTEALQHYATAASLFREANDSTNRGALEIIISDTLLTLGRRNAALDHALAALDAVKANPSRGVQALMTGGWILQSVECNRSALLFLTAAVDESIAAPPDFLPGALFRRADIRRGIGDIAGATDDTHRGANAVANLDPVMRSRYAPDLLYLRALTQRSAGAAEPLLRDAITAAEDQNKMLIAAMAHRVLARNAVQRGSATAASAEFDAALVALESKRRLIAAPGQRIQFDDTLRDVRDEYVEFLLKAGREAGALEVVERVRARDLRDRLARTEPWTVRSLIQSLPSGTAVVDFAVLRNRIVAWVVTADGLRVHNIANSSGVRRTSTDLVARVVAGEDAREDEDSLYAALIDPLALAVGANMIVVPDDFLQTIPFAVLRDRNGYVIEQHEVDVVPSAALAGPARPAVPQNALILVHPQTDGEPNLPAAISEADGVARQFPKAVVLRNDEASVDRLLSLAPRFDVVHISGHSSGSGSSALLLAKTAAHRNGELIPDDLEHEDLRETAFVALGACSTTAGEMLIEGRLSLPRAFLAAGAHAVAASLWPVDDEASAELFRNFYPKLRTGNPAPAALRDAQLAMLRDPRFQKPRQWGAFEIISAE